MEKLNEVDTVIREAVGRLGAIAQLLLIFRSKEDDNPGIMEDRCGLSAAEFGLSFVDAFKLEAKKPGSLERIWLKKSGPERLLIRKSCIGSQDWRRVFGSAGHVKSGSARRIANRAI